MTSPTRTPQKKRRFSFKRSISLWLRTPIAGPLFRIYAPRRSWSSPPQPDRVRVLIANLLPSLGDTICYLALVDVLVAARPDIEITWLADNAMAGLLQTYPGIHRVLSVKIPPSRLLRVPTIKSFYKLYSIFSAVLRMDIRSPFDLVIVPRGGVDPSFSSHAAWVMNLQRSYGYSHLVEPDEVDHNFGDPLLTNLVREVTQDHEAMRALTLLETAGLIPNVRAYWNEKLAVRGLQKVAARNEVDSLFSRLDIKPGTPYIVIAPGAGLPKKTWPAAKFHEICKRITEQTTFRVILAGTKAEVPLCDGILRNLGPAAISSAGQLNLSELLMLLSHATLFVGNDSGTGHLAGALGRPTLSLHVQARSGDPRHIAAPEHYKPAGPDVTVLQPEHFLLPCWDRCESAEVHCLDQITVDHVWIAITEILARLRTAG